MPSLFQKSQLYFDFQMEIFPFPFLSLTSNENWKLHEMSHVCFTFSPPWSLWLKNNYNEIGKLTKDFVSGNAPAVMPYLFWGVLSIKLRAPAA